MQTENEAKNIDILSQIEKPEFLALSPTTVDEYFLQTLGNLVLLQKKQASQNILKLLQQYEGSYSNTCLLLKYISYCMEKELSHNYSHFSILRILGNWMDNMKALNKKKAILLKQSILTADLNVLTFEQMISYLNYISLDLISLVRLGTEASQKVSSSENKYEHLNGKDLIDFLRGILPITLHNIFVPRTFFPATLLDSSTENVNMLYSNCNLEHLTHTKPHYLLLMKTSFKCLLEMNLQSSEVKEAVVLCFKFFYVAHHDKNLGASQLVMEWMKKMEAAVRYAISDQIILFIKILEKLGKNNFLFFLKEKFDWMNEFVKLDTLAGTHKAQLKPFPGFLKMRYCFKVQAGKKVRRYLQTYDRFSLLYFRITCVDYDISVNFYHMGQIDGTKLTEPKLLFKSEKKEGVLDGSIEIVEKGLYMFEFDNSYSWMKGKSITYQICIMVPLQIKEDNPSQQIKNIIYGEDTLNKAVEEKILGEVFNDTVKMTSTKIQVGRIQDEGVNVYFLKLKKNTGAFYQYQTQNQQRMCKKVKSLDDGEVHWFCEGKKMRTVADTMEWLKAKPNRNFSEEWQETDEMIEEQQTSEVIEKREKLEEISDDEQQS